jgi:hypothetical protein
MSAMLPPKPPFVVSRRSILSLSAFWRIIVTRVTISLM